MSSGTSSDSLQAYLDSLLADSLLSDTQPAAPNRIADEAALKLASGSNIAPLPSSSRARTAPPRPYAEPIRTLNLHMPLPPVAAVTESAPVLETSAVVEKTAVAEKIVTVEKTSVAEKAPAVETALRVEPKTVEVAPPSIPVAPVISEPAEPIADTQSTTGLSAMAPPAAWLSNGRPQWAQQPFECLIFKAGGLQLAAPLVELGSIYPLEKDAITEIFGQTHWFMGLLPVKEYNVRAMDTALIVMPERYSGAMRENYRYVVSLFGSDWGLAVDAVVGTTLLDPERVRWRGERSKRPWLAGTLIDQMCALFDIAQLAWLFHNQDRKRAPK